MNKRDNSLPQEPCREDGLKWKTQHHRAAQMRARGRSWDAVAHELRVKPGTARNYGQLGGFAALVEHYRAQLFDAEIQDHFYRGSLEALNVLRDQWRLSEDEARAIEQRIEDGDFEDEKELGYLENKLKGLTRSSCWAADKYLANIGFAKYRSRVAELEAEKATQGHFGQHHHVDGSAESSRVEESDAGERAHKIAAILGELELPGRADRADDAADE